MLKVQELREIIELIDQSSITEFTYEAEGATVSLKKAGNENIAVVSEATVQAKPVQAKPQVQVAEEQPVSPEVQPAAAKLQIMIMKLYLQWLEHFTLLLHQKVTHLFQKEVL